MSSRSERDETSAGVGRRQGRRGRRPWATGLRARLTRLRPWATVARLTRPGTGPADRRTRLVAGLVAVQLVGSLGALGWTHGQGAGDPATPVAAPQPPAVESARALGAAVPKPPPPPAAPPARPGSDSAAIFAREFPAQAAATQRDGDPSSSRWALLVGINDYAGRTRDNIGSHQDAVLLRRILLANGWRDDHVLLLGERDATHDRVVRGIEWLIRKTDGRSVAVFSYSGHTRQGAASDGDAERLDEGLWAADNNTVWDGELGRILGAVPAGRMWISIQACEGAGFNDPGTERPGRVLTYSSHESEKSYEDPDVGYSVQGRFLLSEGLSDGWGDSNGDGAVSVQEAYHWAAPRTATRTASRQTPILVDGVGSPFTLRVP